MSKPNCGAIVAPCHYPACLSPDGSQCLWPPTISVTAPKLLEERDAARAEVAALRAENERLRIELHDAVAERNAATDTLMAHGFVRCDIAACNCGRWHPRYGLQERFNEFKQALDDAGHPLSNANGNRPLNALMALIAERDEYEKALRGVLKWVEDESGSAAGCPTHFHEVAGVWDDDAGALLAVWDDDAGALLAGNPCADCAAWDAARAALEHKNG